jgi:hypothetical protein
VRRRISEKAERRPCVFRVREPEKSRDDLDVRIDPDARGHQSLCPPVHDYDEQGEEEVNATCAIRGHGECYCKLFS